VARCLLFDLGNVLIDFDHRIVSRELARGVTREPPLRAEAIDEYIFGDAGPASPNAQMDRGTLSLAALHADVAARFSLPVSIEEFRHAWSAIFAGALNQTVVDQLVRLATRGFDVRICSNTNDAHWSWLRSTYPLLEELDREGRCLLSFRIGQVKTDAGFFAHAATVTGLPAADHLLIDDRQDNCSAAEAAGMRALLFEAGEKADAARSIDDALGRIGWLADTAPR
jgi:FMN phosphatase YigB (HAD superfamily)